MLVHPFYEIYNDNNKIVSLLINNRQKNPLYKIDEKQKSASLTEEGHNEVEKILLSNNLIRSTSSLYEPKNIQLLPAELIHLFKF